jgi:hypothetical protein
MSKSRYTKEDLEWRCQRQLDYLEVLGRRIQLLERQNELLVKFNHRICEALSDQKPPVPYAIKRKTSKRTIKSLAAEMQANFPEI